MLEILVALIVGYLFGKYQDKIVTKIKDWINKPKAPIT